jgi:hypothetical protein
MASTRRDFLQQTAAAATAATLGPIASTAERSALPSPCLPLARPIPTAFALCPTGA